MKRSFPWGVVSFASSIRVLTPWLLSSAIATTAAASPIISIAPVTTQVTVGDTFAVDVVVGATDAGTADDISDLYAYQLSIAYDPALLSALTVTEGSFLSTAGPTLFFGGLIDNTAGLISFNAGTLLGPIPGASGSGVLFRVVFMALSVGAGTISPVFAPQDGDGLLDSSLVPIAPIATVDGTLSVDARPTPMPEPATLFLTAVGIGAVAFRHSRRKHS